MEIKNIIKEKHFVPILIILDILMTFSTLYVSYTIDSVISNIENSQALGSITIIHIVISISLYVLFTIFVPLLYKVYYYRVKRNYNFYITKKIIEKNSEYFRSNDAGSIINVAYNIGDRIAFYYARVYINIITESISFILVVASMFFYSYKVTLVFLACTLLMSFIISLLAKKVGTASAKLNEKENIVYTKFNQFVENINLIKNLNKEKYYADDYEDNYDNSYYAANKQFSRIDAYYKVVFNDLIIVLPLLILIISILLKDYLGVTISSIVSIYFLSSKIQEPIDSLSSVYSDYKENKINLSYIKDLLVSNDEILKPINDFNKIEFSSKGITFSNNTILNNVKIEISKGDFISLCGSSGSGKSTVLKLLTKELDNENVNIMVDNEDIRELNLTGLLLIVTQQSYMFSDTIKNNICCGDMYKEDELREIYKLTLLEEFIGKYGEDKIIDFSDSNISGGEKQRIALARILIRKPKLLLLDEITSSLDDTNSHLLAKNIYEYAKTNNITVVVISHKDEFLEYSNKVIKIN